MDTQVPNLSNKRAFLFDYGDTLVKYYKGSAEFFPILKKALANISTFLTEQQIFHENLDLVWKRAILENYESKDYRVRPLADRLQRIFQLHDLNELNLMKMQEKFMEPIYSIAEMYQDSIPTLKELKHKFGVSITIVSNTPWGSPSSLWKKELQRFGLDSSRNFIDLTAFCVEVGWRKPAPPVFQYVLDTLHLDPKDCVFIGDNHTWDVKGPNQMKIDAILLDRKQKYNHLTVPKIHGLEELFELI